MNEKIINTLAFGVNGLEMKAIFESTQKSPLIKVEEPNYHGIHDHVNYEVFLIANGEVELITENTSCVYRCPVLLVPPRSRHFSVIRGEVTVFFLSPSRLSRTEEVKRLEGAFDGQVIAVPEERIGEGLVGGLFRSLEQSSACSKQRVAAYLELIFSDVLEYLGVFEVKDGEKPRENVYFSVVEDFVNGSYASGGTLDGLSLRLGLSRRQTSRVVRKLYGEPLSSVMKNKRLSVAAALLKNTKKTVTDIAEEVGYGSRNKFYCDFREKYGVTPLRSRRLEG